MNDDMKKMISPSMMCADFLNLGNDIRDMEACGIEYLHIDIMDGVFVPNFTLGTDYIKKLHKASSIPLDLHLMVSDVDNKLNWFEFGEGDYVAIHAEACTHIQRALALIRSKGAKAMLALNPATSLNVLDEILPDLDGILIMTVNPGYAGQKLIPQTLEKIARLRNYLDSNGYGHIDIEVDGNVSFENARKMSDAGANIFVAGSSSMFMPGVPLPEGIAKLREAIN